MVDAHVSDQVRGVYLVVKFGDHVEKAHPCL